MRTPLPRDHFATPLKQTPLHGRLAAVTRPDGWYGWNGFVAPRVCRDEEAEYFAIRNAASLFDVSPIIKYRVTGREAAACLDRLLVSHVAPLPVGEVQYTAWCDDEGKILEDGLLFRLGAEEFLLFTQERHLNWFLDSAIGFDVAVAEISDEIAGLALQGPTSFAVLDAAGLGHLADLAPMRLRAIEIDGVGAVTVSRTGFTGDLGYELFTAPEAAPALWDRLMAAGALYGITPIGSAALDLARLEAGYVQSGSDFVPAEHAVRADRRRSPYEAGLGFLVALDKPMHFTGKRALSAEREAKGSRHVLVGLEIDGNVPAEHAIVYHRGRKEVGHVTAAAWSPTAKRNIALASLLRPYESGRHLWVEIYTLRELEYARAMVRAKVVARPFFDPPRRTATPPGRV